MRAIEATGELRELSFEDLQDTLATLAGGELRFRDPRGLPIPDAPLLELANPP